jgi:hypothetical protein
MKTKVTNKAAAARAVKRDPLDPPIVHGLQPDNGDGQDNLLPISDPPVRLPVIIPKWPGDPASAVRPHRIELKWNDLSSGSMEHAAPVDLDNEANRTLHVAAANLTEGMHKAQYLVVIGTDVPMVSQELRITIDTSAPVLGTPNALAFPVDVVQDGITPAYLAANNDQVKAGLPSYTVQQPDDVITAFWDTASDDNTPALTKTLTFADHVEPIELIFSGALIREHGPGDRMVRYQVEDRAGNKTAFSDYVELKVVEAPPEEDLLAAPQFRYQDLADRDDNTLFKDVITAGTGLVILLPEWDNPAPNGAADLVQLEFARGASPDPADFKEAVSESYPGPIAPGQFPLTIVLPNTCLIPDGPVSLRYWVTSYNDAKVMSATATLIADTTPPFREMEPPALTVPDVPITDAYLDDHMDGVECSIPVYVDWQPDDRVVYWWLNDVPDDPTEIDITGEAEITTEPPFTFAVPAHAVRSTGDGGCYVVYTVIDKATNRSRLSVYAPVAVALGPLPGNLQDPVVEQAGDGQVDLADAHNGVIVGIPRFDNWKPTDRIEVTWGTTVLDEEQIGSSPAELISIRVPTQVLKDEYGDTEGGRSTNVSYRILRGDVGSNEKAIIVDVDLSVIGPELPEWPDPENPTLAPAAVYGATSNVLNQLTREDTGLDARCDLTLYAPVNAGEVLKVYWNDAPAPVAEYIVQADDRADDVVSCKIGWEHIELAGNALEVPVYYTIGRPNSPNAQRSPLTKVNVDAVVIIPEAPSFLGQSENGWLNCHSLDGDDHAVRVQVPDISRYLGAGDQVTLTWTPLTGLVGEDVLEAAIKVEPIILDALHPATGFVWRIQPYATHVGPTYDPDGPGGAAARGRIHYTLTYKGETLTSETTESKVGMFDGTGGCDVKFLDEVP